MKPTAIYAFGPDPTQDRYGDEQPEWTLFLGDDDAEPVGKLMTAHTFDGCLAAFRMLRQQHPQLEPVFEASRA
jgi:hypothetical protein